MRRDGPQLPASLGHICRQLFAVERLTLAKQLHIVLNCTSRKRTKPSTDLLLRSIRRPLADRAEEWAARISGAPNDVTPDELYLGEYWQAGRQLIAEASGRFEVRSWVVSAGYGLLAPDDLLSPYGATFAPGHADSVHRSNDAVTTSRARLDWWTALTESKWRDGTRSITDVFAAHPRDRFLVCIGPSYLDAVRADLERASRQLTDLDGLTVVGSGQGPSGELSHCFVSVPGKLRQPLGGSLTSVSVRAARHFVRHFKALPSPEAGRRSMNRLAAKTADLPAFDGSRLSDDATLRWIASATAADPTLTVTRALRQLRDEGFACEQSRFSELFGRRVAAR